jgi:hypothetical protein
LQPSRTNTLPPLPNYRPTSTAQSLFPWRRLNLGPSLIGIPVARLSMAYEKQEGIFSSTVIPQWPFLVISNLCSLYAASHILLSIIHCKAA